MEEKSGALQCTSHTQAMVQNGPWRRTILAIDLTASFITDDLILIWKKGNTILALGDSLMNKKDSRVKLEAGEHGNTLVISLAEPADAGEYTCQLSASKPKELTHKVDIRGE